MTRTATAPDCLTHLWTDLETTGLDFMLDEIVEFGVIGTNDNLDELFRYEQVVKVSRGAANRAAANKYVRPMHEANGLMKFMQDDALRFKLPSVASAERDIINLINKFDHPDTLVLAGSGVWQFDIRMLRAHTPALASLLDVRETYDTGLIRKAYKRATSTDLTMVNDGKDHRALTDISIHLEEARIQQAMFREHARQVQSLTLNSILASSGVNA